MALYHKHRPQTFASVTGQEHIVTTLKNQVAHHTIAHAYLFSGPRGVGKTTSARVLAKAVNCLKRKEGDAEPCDDCTSCIDIAASRAIDVIEIDAASHTGVDHVREHIIDNAQFKPTQSKYKVFIIDEVHMLSTSAFNALLKTLEEPPAHVVFILATTELHKIPETIISRCQRYHFKKIPYDTMKTYIETIAKDEHVTIDPEVLDRIILKSDGCARDAMSLLDQLMATGEKTITSETASLVLPTGNQEDVITYIACCIDQDIPRGLTHLQTVVDAGIHMEEFIDDVLALLRFLLIATVGGSTDTISADMGEKTLSMLRTWQKRMTPQELLALIDIIMHRRSHIVTSPLPQLPLEMILVEWATKNHHPSVSPSSSISPHTPPTPATPPTPEPLSKPAPKSEPPSSTKEAPPSTPEPTKTDVSPVESSRTTPLTLDEVKKQWGMCLKTLEKGSTSLVFILKSAVIQQINGNVVEIGVPYSFHLDTIHTTTHKKLIEKTLTELLKTSVTITATILPQAEEEKNAAELQNLAAAFGGEVVA